MKPDATAVPDEQLIYARWVRRGTQLGLGALVAAFLAYAFALLEPLVPLQQLPRLWSLPAEQYVQISGAPTGWDWLAFLDKGDYLNLLGVALLGLVTVVCYVRLLVALLARRALLPAALAVAQILVLVAAASGFFAVGH